MARQIQLADDLRTQQAHDIRANRVLETRIDFLGNRGTANQVTPLQYQHTFPRAGEVGGVDQTVVTSAYDNRVVVRSPLLAHLKPASFPGRRKASPSRLQRRASDGAPR